MAPLVLVNVVGLTERLLGHAPRLSAWAQAGWRAPLREVLPAVTCTAQASLLTGRSPRVHGIVGNGWYWRELGEVRFWLQCNSLIEAEPLYATARRVATARRRAFHAAKLFWWFNQGAAVDFSVTPKPYYGADGNKVFAIQSDPPALAAGLEADLGPFPFAAFWGPMAGRASSQWIAQAAAWLLRRQPLDLLLVYLPHLDYDLQRYGAELSRVSRAVGELDAACVPLLDAARLAGARVWFVSEYAHVSVRQPVLPNRALRAADLLAVRPGPFGENLDVFGSRAFAVCDHQIAHLYVKASEDRPYVRDLLEQLPGVAAVVDRPAQQALGLDHPRAGDLIALAEPDAWFAYPFWHQDDQAPDYARTVDIHRKPGYDPCELFLDPKLRWPQARLGLRLLQKKIGLRTLFDVVPLDPTLVKGSHGLAAAEAADRPLLIGDGEPPASNDLHITDLRRLVLQALDLCPDQQGS